MRQYEQMRHMVPCEFSSTDSTYVIPHHCVVRPDSTTTRLRVVFDASCPTTNRRSLNDIVHVGPKLQSDIVDLVTKFRLHVVVFTADICKMYRQILIRPEDRSYQHIFWRKDPNEPLKEYELNTVTYGVSSSPYLAIRTLRQLAEDYESQFPLAAQILREETFMDDITSGATSIENAKLLKKELVALLHLGKFELRKWSSNCPEVLADIPSEYFQSPKLFTEPNSELTLKILGIKWDPLSDQFSYTFSNDFKVEYTKRSILSVIARIFDPLGWICPVVFSAKLLIQEMWRLNLAWDDPIPSSLAKQWHLLTANLSDLQSIKLPRLVLPPDPLEIHLVGFCDGSSKGYGCCVYLCAVTTQGTTTNLLIGKSKIAPLKPLTTNRLELCAAVLLARVLNHMHELLKPKLNIRSVKAFTDSSTVLSWLHTPPHLLKVFVANRVVQITDLISSKLWYHVSTHDNPADCCSRGTTCEVLGTHKLWWTGPSWLHQAPFNWPSQKVFESEQELSELKPLPSNCVVSTLSDDILRNLISKFSSFEKLQRVLAWCLRFAKNIRLKRDDRNVSPLSLSETDDALIYLVKYTQGEFFSHELRLLQEGLSCVKSIQKLNPFLDEAGIMRVGGRIRHSSLPHSAKHPIMLPKLAPLSQLIVDNYHLRYLHCGPRTLQSLIQRSFWILGLRLLIRSRLSKCITCFKSKPISCQPSMGDLPLERLQSGRCFQTTGIDFGGPFILKESKRRNARTYKAWICLFICLSVKAVHLEVVTELSTEAFLAALDRFVSRRNICHKIISDCGTNFVGSNRFLNEMYKMFYENRRDIADGLAVRRIIWKFNPPGAPHFGGIFESGIKSTKYHLKRVVGSQVLTLEEMFTILTKIEAVLNSRPLCALSSDPNEVDVLTPAHFLVGGPLMCLPEVPQEDNSSCPRSRWQMLQKITQNFWRIWQDSKRDHCNKTVDIYDDVSSPPVTPENFGRPLTCTYRFRAFRGSPKDWILRIRFKKFKVGTLINGTTCHKGYLQIVDGNAKTDVSNRKEPGLFCGEIEQPQMFISETNFVKIVFHADNFTDQTYFSFDSRAEQQFEVYLRYGQHPELYPNRRGEVVAGSYCERVFRDCRLQTCYVQSAAYPGVYPRNLHCRYHLNTRLPYIKLYIENEEFNIDGQRCENIMTCPMRPITSGAENCPYDYIKIYDGKDESAAVIGTFCGMGKFPYSIIGTSQDLFVEFVSSPAGPLLNTGFHFNVGNWPGHVEAPGSRVGTCDWVLTAESLKKSGDSEGIFLSVAHWYPPHTSCTYLMQGFPGQVVRLYFPSFRINRIESPIVPFTGDCGESLTLYDAPRPDDARIIKTFCDTFSRPMEKHDFVSTGNAMFVRFESKTGSYSGSSLYYWAHYDFFNNTRFGEPVQGTACDEVIASWKQRAGRLRSPLNTLVYKQAPPGEDVHCLYRFVTDKRIYARVILTILSINFKDHPYTPVTCQNCYEDRADKLIIWEPSPGKPANTTLGVSTTPMPLHLAVQRSLGSCLCAKHANTVSRNRPYRVVSSGETLNLQLIVDNAHAAASYFKNPSALFEARYEFVHGPLCGPAVLAAASDGEIVYPHVEALGYTEPPKRIQCIWDLEIEEKRDIWLHFDSIKFASRHCEDGNIQIFLPGRIEPYLSICGENVSLARELPILSAGELGFESLDDPLVIEKEKTRSIRILFIGSASPARAAFKIAWTGLYHLPKNSDGTLMTSRLTEGGSLRSSESGQGCDFICPGDEALCIPARLICNGVVNCPNVTSGERKFWTDEDKRAREAYSEDSLRRLGLLDSVTGLPLGKLNDESPELCSHARSSGGGEWTAPVLGAVLAVLLGICALAAAWRLCCRKRSPDEESLDY